MAFPSFTGGVELFDEFFESGMEESISPFLTPASRRWGVNLPLKSSLLAAFLLLGSFVLSFFPAHHSLSNLLLLFTYFFAGIPALIASVEDIFDLEINIDVLMTLAAFLSVLIGSGKEGALLLVLFSFSGAMEEAVRSKAKGAISSLKKLSPSKALVVLEGGTMVERSVRDIKAGTRIHVRAGEVIPLDGKIVSGTSSVNLVHLTGENMPQTKGVGATVPAGGRNLEGALTVEVTHTSSDSTLARIIQLITQAQEAKPRLQRWFDRLSNGYALTIISLSALFAVLLPLFFHISYSGKEGSIYRALAFLIAASPCALIIAIPIAYLSAVSSCARNGILLKGGVILDALASCNTLALDKTGTVTQGELSCLGIDDREALALAYALEQNATHPIARSLVRYAEEKNSSPPPIEDFKSIPGYGLEGKSKGRALFIGNAEFIFPKLSPAVKKEMEEQTTACKQEGLLFTILLVDQKPFLIKFKDAVRPGIKGTLRAVQEKLGMHVLMLTGDHQASAAAIARETGIDHFYADLRPEDKLEHIGKLARENPLAMVGDGINDAPALARATVGISMGKVGSGTAVDASDIVLLQDHIHLLEWLILKARKTVTIVRQNVLLAAGAIVIATLPALLGWVPLWVAVLLHEGGTVVVGINALRLLKR